MGVEIAERGDLGELGRAGRERPGLVEQQDASAGERLERAAALHDDPALGRSRDARDDRDRRGQDQRTWRRYDEHRERAHRIAADGPREPRDPERDRDEDHGVPVGQADERRLLPLSLLDQPDDAGVRASVGARDRAQVERRTGVDRARTDLLALAPFDGPGLAGKRRLVEHPDARDEEPVDRHDLAVLHEQQVARSHLPDRHRRERALPVPVRAAGRALEQRGEFPVRASVGEVLEGAPRREHERDHGAGQVLLERERAAHREDGDQVNAGVTVQDAAQDLPADGDDPDRGREGPYEVRGVGVVGPPSQDPADHDAEDRQDQEDRARGQPAASHGIGLTRTRAEIGRARGARRPPSPCGARTRARLPEPRSGDGAR